MYTELWMVRSCRQRKGTAEEEKEKTLKTLCFYDWLSHWVEEQEGGADTERSSQAPGSSTIMFSA